MLVAVRKRVSESSDPVNPVEKKKIRTPDIAPIPVKEITTTTSLQGLIDYGSDSSEDSS